jgi:signal transduction histidine kinase
MSKSVERYGNELRALRNYAETLGYACSVEQVYAFGLNVLSELFDPDTAFVALSESGSSKETAIPPLLPGFLSEVIFPIRAGEKLTGRFMLQYKNPRGFTETDVLLIEMIALHAGAIIHQLHRQKQKDEVIAMAVHELRSPLAGILGGAFMARTGKDGTADAGIEMVERNARTQAKLVDELLHVSQIDTGKVPLLLKTLDLAAVLDHVVEEAAASASANNTSFVTSFDRPMHVKGDERRLWQIFSNLLSNAIRFAPNGEVRIGSVVEDGMIRITVVDNGAGIPREHLPHIFERFRQGHAAKLQPHDGLGLGLSIVKDLVTMHGGSVTAESDGLGKGANFVVSLPTASGPVLS